MGLGLGSISGYTLSASGFLKASSGWSVAAIFMLVCKGIGIGLRVRLRFRVRLRVRLRLRLRLKLRLRLSLGLGSGSTCCARSSSAVPPCRTAA